MQRLIVILSLVGAFGVSEASGQADTLRTQSSSVAFATGVVSTALPVVVGGLLWARARATCNPGESCRGPDRIGPALLMASGFVIGPSLGYAVAGHGGRATAWAGIRAGLVLVSFIPAYGICGWNCKSSDSAYNTAWLVVATGAGLGAASAIYDLIRLHHLPRPTQRTASVVPYVDGRTAGAFVHWEF